MTRLSCAARAALFAATLCGVPAELTTAEDGTLAVPRGDHQLSGRLFRSGTSTGTLVLLLPGFPDGGEDVLGLGAALSASGVDVVTIRYSGTHGSGGRYSIAESLEDVRSSVAWLREAPTQAALGTRVERLVVGGYSFGGGMALAYAAQDPGIEATFSIAGTDHGQFARRYASDGDYADLFDRVFDSYRAPEGPVRFGGRQAIVELLADPEPYDLRLLAPRLADRRLLLIGGWQDPWVSLGEHLSPVARALSDAGAERVDVEMMFDDHGFVGSGSQIARRLREWLTARRPRIAASARWARKICAEDVVIVQPDASALSARIPGRHRLLVDPEGKGMLALIAQRCEEYSLDGEPVGAVSEMHVWARLESDRDTVEVEGCDETWPTMRWFSLSAGTTSPHVREALASTGLPARSLSELVLRRDESSHGGELATASECTLSWEVDRQVRAARLVGLDHEVHSRRAGVDATHRIRARGRLVGFGQPGTLRVGECPLLGDVLSQERNQPVVLHTFETLEASVAWGAAVWTEAGAGE